MRVEYLAHGGGEEFVLAVEVVVERTHSDVGGLGDVEHRHVEPARGDEALRGADQCRPGALLASLHPADARLGRLLHHYLASLRGRPNVPGQSVLTISSTRLTDHCVVCDDFISYTTEDFDHGQQPQRSAQRTRCS